MSKENGPVADNARAKRLADLIREVVAQKLQRGIKDPRLGSQVTITDTRVTGDLREATVARLGPPCGAQACSPLSRRCFRGRWA